VLPCTAGTFTKLKPQCIAASCLICFLQAATAGSGHDQVQLPPLFIIKRGHPAAHKYQVTSICWYPVDTGLFITGSADQDVKVWDTNT
jgi:WD40 repeat protein